MISALLLPLLFSDVPAYAAVPHRAIRRSRSGSATTAVFFRVTAPRSRCGPTTTATS